MQVPLVGMNEQVWVNHELSSGPVKFEVPLGHPSGDVGKAAELGGSSGKHSGLGIKMWESVSV